MAICRRFDVVQLMFVDEVDDRGGNQVLTKLNVSNSLSATLIYGRRVSMQCERKNLIASKMYGQP